ncbi:MAG: GNAT family N-acetyltransferase [Bacteroidota bacterium]
MNNFLYIGLDIPNMHLETERLHMVPINWKDVKDLNRLHSIPEVAQFNTLGIPKNLVETRDHIAPIIEALAHEEPHKWAWTIRLEPTFAFIGELGMNLSAKKYKRGEIYYNLLPTYWGQGYATEAVKALISFGFESLELHRIEAGVATENLKSIALLERVGMQREGLHRQILPIRGGWKDNYSYAVLEGDKRGY